MRAPADLMSLSIVGPFHRRSGPTVPTHKVIAVCSASQPHTAMSTTPKLPLGTWGACLLQPQSVCPPCFSPLLCIASSGSVCQQYVYIGPPLPAAPPFHSQQTSLTLGRGICFCLATIGILCWKVRPVGGGQLPVVIPPMLRPVARVGKMDSFGFAEQDMRNQLCGARCTEFQIQGHKSFHTQSKLRVVCCTLETWNTLRHSCAARPDNTGLLVISATREVDAGVLQVQEHPGLKECTQG